MSIAQLGTFFELRIARPSCKFSQHEEVFTDPTPLWKDENQPNFDERTTGYHALVNYVDSHLESTT